MPLPLHWSPQRDAIIRTMRQDGETWLAIGRVLGVSRWTAIARGRQIGAVRPAAPLPPPVLRNPAWREPLPAGHPDSWGAITRGTALDGQRYPWPPLPLEGDAP